MCSRCSGYPSAVPVGGADRVAILQQLRQRVRGRPAARVARQVILSVSRDTLLQVVRRRALPPLTGALQVVVIDDFAWKRGQRYGTIICDLERRWIVDLLPDREPGTVAAWLINWPPGAAEPTKFWFSSLAAGISRTRPVRHAMLRWRIERDHQALKQATCIGHYEGRGWRGFRHHVTLCIAACGFLVAERAALPPSAERLILRIKASAIPATWRLRGDAVPA